MSFYRGPFDYCHYWSPSSYRTQPPKNTLIQSSDRETSQVMNLLTRKKMSNVTKLGQSLSDGIKFEDLMVERKIMSFNGVEGKFCKVQYLIYQQKQQELSEGSRWAQNRKRGQYFETQSFGRLMQRLQRVCDSKSVMNMAFSKLVRVI